jgi:hypothetical protein
MKDEQTAQSTTALPDHVDVKITLEIGGKVSVLKEVSYQVDKKMTAFTLDDLARIVFNYETMFCSASTYAMSGYLKEAEKVLPKRDGETADSVFAKYWINSQQYADKRFDDINQGGHQVFEDEGDYLKYLVWDRIKAFFFAPTQVKYGFLYYLHKYQMDNSMAEYQKDLDLVPQFLKDIIDNELMVKPTPQNPIAI